MTRLMGMAYTRAPVPADHQRCDDEVGCVGDRRQRVGRQHSKTGDARQAFVMRQVRRNRLAEEKTFECRKGGFFSHADEALGQATACYHTRFSERGFRLRIARRYLVSGRVQGVGFRFFADAVAQREGLHGWVRNLPDGRVEALAEGEADALDRFERASVTARRARASSAWTSTTSRRAGATQDSPIR